MIEIAGIRSWIINIMVMMILAVIIENIMPNNSLRKYCRLVLGLVIMLIIITPLSNFSFGIETIENFIYEAENIVDINNTVETLGEFEGINNEQIVMVYRDKLKRNIARTIEEITKIKEPRVDITINDDINSDDFGRITFIIININKSNKSDENIKRIEKINISGNNFEVKNSNENIENISEQDKKTINEIVEELSIIYGLAKNKIEVQID